MKQNEIDFKKTNSNNGLLFFYDWVKPFEKLNGNDFKKLFLAMINYQQNGGEIPDFKGKADIIASFVFPQLERRKEISEQNRKNAEKRWRSVEEESAIPSECQPQCGAYANLCHKDRDEDKDRDQDKTSSSPSPLLSEEKTGAVADSEDDEDDVVFIDPDFSSEDRIDKKSSSQEIQNKRFCEFWSAYPKKRRRSAALEEFLKLDPDEALWQRIKDALERHKRSKTWRQENGRFIPLADKWLNDTRWEEDVVIDAMTENELQNQEMWDEYFLSLYNNPPKKRSAQASP